jgi:P-type Cu+ transporter
MDPTLTLELECLSNVEIEIPIEQVREGDVMIVRPGERIPTDGNVV